MTEHSDREPARLEPGVVICHKVPAMLVGLIRASGEHVHVATIDGMFCAAQDPCDLPVWAGSA